MTCPYCRHQATFQHDTEKVLSPCPHLFFVEVVCELPAQAIGGGLTWSWDWVSPAAKPVVEKRGIQVLRELARHEPGNALADDVEWQASEENDGDPSGTERMIRCMYVAEPSAAVSAFLDTREP